MHKYQIFTFIFFFAVMCSNAQSTALDSLESLLDSYSGRERIELLNELCWQFGPVNIEKSEKYGRQALRLAKLQNDSLLLAQVYNDLGTVFYRTASYDSALSYYLQSARIREKENDTAALAASHSKIGLVYQEMGRFERSSEFQLAALRYYESMGDSIRMSQCYSNLSIVYMSNKDYEKALRYTRMALAIFDAYNYSYGQGTAHGNLGLANKYLENYDSASFHYLQALKIFKQIGDKPNEANALLNLGELARLQGDNQQGINYYQEAIELSNQIEDNHTFAMATANLANIYSDFENYSLAEQNFKTALAIALESEILVVVHQCYRGLATLFERKGDFRQAYLYKQEQFNIRDTLYNIEKYKQLSNLQTKYETEKREQKIQLLSAENEIKSLEINRQKNLVWTIVISISLLLVILVLWYNRKRLQQRAMLEAEQSRFRKQLLDASVEAEENERKRMARELHDGVAQQLTGLKMAWQVIASKIKETKPDLDNQLGEISSNLDETADEVRNLSHQMMPRVLGEEGLIPAIEDLLQKSLKYSKIQYSFEQFGIKERFNEKVELSLYRICQELVNNVVKHSGADKLAVQLIKSKSKLVLMIEDNGKGFDGGKKQGSSLGMMNIASRIDTVNGEINYEPSPESGTVATVRIPLKIK